MPRINRKLECKKINKKSISIHQTIDNYLKQSEDITMVLN
jgi:Cu/Zn superoxide dismutase